MGNPTLIKEGTAESAITKYSIVKPGAADGLYAQASADTDALCGVWDSGFDVNPGETLGVVKAGIADVEYGGAVARGALLTSDANGCAITATTGRVIGIAEVSGVAGDIGQILIAPGVI